MTIHLGETAHRYALELPLTAKDRRDLAVIRNSPARMDALPEDLDRNTSEESLVHAVFEAGLLALREKASEAGYKELTKDVEFRSTREEKARNRSRTRRHAGLGD